jgi:hypothetical protein
MVRQNTNYLSPSLYSEEERIIGSWINGKPLYQKTFYFESSGKSETSGVKTELTLGDCSSLNIDIAASITTILVTPARSSMPIGVNNTTNNNIDHYYYVFLSAGKELKIRLNTTTEYPLYVTMKYTKTTDTENSFTTDMIKDYIVQTGEIESYSDEEVINAVNDLW